jgi:hypothetical protein
VALIGYASGKNLVQRAPQIELATEGKTKPEVVNIMAALKESMQVRGVVGAFGSCFVRPPLALAISVAS